MKQLFIIAGCNGAGKTTASYTILPEVLDCREFVNADEIARGLSPFQPERTSVQAGRLMLNRIKHLLLQGESFAFETTLSPKSYVQTIDKAKELGYSITLLFFWLNSQELAVERVKTRVKEGGHHIPENIIRRRYSSGLVNFFNLYKPVVNNWIMIDNSSGPSEVIAESSNRKEKVYKQNIWKSLMEKYYEK
jgi:predicted ABC-type ATPase